MALLRPFPVSKAESSQPLPSIEASAQPGLFGFGRSRPLSAAAAPGPLSPHPQTISNTQNEGRKQELSSQTADAHGITTSSSLPRGGSLGECGPLVSSSSLVIECLSCLRSVDLALSDLVASTFRCSFASEGAPRCDAIQLINHHSFAVR
jgi:hypothetical protein